MPVPHETDCQEISNAESQDACQQGTEGISEPTAQVRRNGFQERLPGMEREVERHNMPQESPQRREDALYTSAAQGCDEQSEFLSPLPFHLPAGGLQGDAKYEQQD